MSGPGRDTVGRYFVDEHGEIWRQYTYCEYPTASVEKVADPTQRRGGAVGSRILDGLELLEPERAVPLPSFRGRR